MSFSSRRTWWPLSALVALILPLSMSSMSAPTAAAQGLPPGASGSASCPWYLGPIVLSGAAGSEGIIVSFLPGRPDESCTTTINTTVSIETTGGRLSSNVTGNPLAVAVPVTFTSGGFPPGFTWLWSPHCADPQPVRITVAAGGQQVFNDLGSGFQCANFGVNHATLSDVGPTQGLVTDGMARSASGTGLWTTATDGAVFNHGTAPFLGVGPAHLNGPVVGMAATPDGHGYWLVASDGGVFSFGDAKFYGSAGSFHLNQPVVGIAATPDGHGYWLVASDGGVFSFGDAKFYGSAGSDHLNQPVVGMAAAPDGHGYWLVASDGGIFTFGTIGFYGSAGGSHINQPVVGMAAAPNSQGYWLVAADGGVFTFGHVGFFGSAGGSPLPARATAIVATPSGQGYWLLMADDGFNGAQILQYGDASTFVHL